MEKKVNFSQMPAAILMSTPAIKFFTHPLFFLLIFGFLFLIPGAVLSQEESDEGLYDVFLLSPGENKLAVINEVKYILGLGLKETKELVDSAPSLIKEGIPKMEAHTIKRKLTEFEAAVEIKPSSVVPASVFKPEKPEFDVLLVSYGENKVKVVKAVKYLLDLGLKESKEMVDTLPRVLKERVGENDAQEMKRVLEKAGATVEFRTTSKANQEELKFDVLLLSQGENKIEVIKAVKNILNLGLKETKELVESAPCLLKVGVNKKEAVRIKRLLAEVEATVEIRPSNSTHNDFDLQGSEFNVYLKSYGEDKLAVIKEVKNILGLGLKESKELVDSTPCLLKEAVSKLKAIEMRRILEEVGAVVEIRE